MWPNSVDENNFAYAKFDTAFIFYIIEVFLLIEISCTYAKNY